MIRRAALAFVGAALGVVALGVTPAAAAGHKILVLPVDGSADTATRARLTAEVVRLARALDGQVATADTTFDDTALAVGCDPRAASCRDEVLATLAVDELVWGTATRDGAQTRLVVRRVARGTALREVATSVAPGDSPERIEAGVASLFAPPVEPAPVIARPPAAPPAPPPRAAALGDPTTGPTTGPETDPATGPESHRDRNLGLVLAGGGGATFVLGLALWASYASQQDKIDHHPTRNRADFDDLTALEDRAARFAVAGDLLVPAGLALAGVGAYLLLRHHDHPGVALAPAPLAHGAGLTLTIAGGL